MGIVSPDFTVCCGIEFKGAFDTVRKRMPWH